MDDLGVEGGGVLDPMAGDPLNDAVLGVGAGTVRCVLPLPAIHVLRADGQFERFDGDWDRLRARMAKPSVSPARAEVKTGYPRKREIVSGGLFLLLVAIAATLGIFYQDLPEWIQIPLALLTVAAGSLFVGVALFFLLGWVISNL